MTVCHPTNGISHSSMKGGRRAQRGKIDDLMIVDPTLLG